MGACFAARMSATWASLCDPASREIPHNVEGQRTQRRPRQPPGWGGLLAHRREVSRLWLLESSVQLVLR